MSGQFNFYSNIHHGKEVIVEAEIQKYFYLTYRNSNTESNIKKGEYFNQQNGDSWEV